VLAQAHDHSTHVVAPASPAPAEVHEHGIDDAVPAVAEPQAELHEHSAAAEAMTAPHDHTAAAPAAVPDRDESPAMQEARHMSLMMHGDSLNYLLLGERFERLEGGAQVWEAQGWVGRDLHKFWFKTEGQREEGETGTAELQALYSRAIAPFWDLQAGLRHDGGQTADRTFAVLGLQGLAPYWFELDLAAFLSEQGKASARLEAEYELRFSQRLLLQPRLELNYGFADDLAAGIGQGFSESSLGLRLRYELRREFAPYLGIEWSRSFGSTARLLSARGERSEELRMLLGLRFWY
jgi:copper resistance protein B